MSGSSIQTRRQFLRAGLATAGCAALGACGGGSDAAAAEDTLDDAGEKAAESVGTVDAPASPQAPGTFVVQTTASQTQVFAPGTATPIVRGALGMSVQVSPDLPPGRSLAVSASGDVSVVAASDSPVVTIDRPWVIEVMDSPIATIVNVTKGITYPPGSYPSTSQGATRWANVMAQASHGDQLEVSPGAIQQVGETSNYFNGLDTCILALWKAVSIRNMRGRGRWSLYPNDELTSSTKSGIVVFAPAEIVESGPPMRGNIVIEGFAFDNWGNTGGSNGLKVRQNYVSKSTWDDYHESVTIRNFKIGKRPFERSASGIAGAAQAWIIEDGHVYDTGDGLGAAPGNDHDFYISGQSLQMRGVRAARNRSSEFPFNQANTLDGHNLKLTFNHATLEGCVIDCGPEGDSSKQIQMKGGGNLVVRGCLIISGVHTQTAQGVVMFEKEANNYGGWTYGLAGHSVLIERNVFINHRQDVNKPMLAFWPSGHSQHVSGVSSVVVRDNIGMSPFPSDLWISNDPTSGGTWAARGNTAVAYSSSETPFANRELLGYTRAAGAIAADGGSMSTRRFQFPHGSVLRNDSLRGLG